MTMTMTMTMSFSKHLQRAIFDTLRIETGIKYFGVLAKFVECAFAQSVKFDRPI